MGLDIDVDTSGVVNALNVLSNSIQRDVTIELDRAADKTIDDAKRSHRFKSRTGNLLEATKKELGISREDIKALFSIDDVKAPYGVYVHDGHSSWSADKYLENAVKRNEGKLIAAAEQGINNAIKKVGL